MMLNFFATALQWLFGSFLVGGALMGWVCTFVLLHQSYRGGGSAERVK